MLDYVTSSKEIKVHIEPEKGKNGWISIEYGNSPREFIENIVNALEQVHKMGEEKCQELLAPCKTHENEEHWSDNHTPGGS